MDFEYIAIDSKGRRVKAFIKADSISAAVKTIVLSVGKLVKIVPMKKRRHPALGGHIFGEPRRVSVKEMAIFTRQMGVILSAGVLLSDALETIVVDMENQHFSDVLQEVLFHIRGGENFSNALAYHPKVFSPYYMAIIRSGEEIGSLGSTMSNMATYMEQDEAMRLKFVGAIRYPVFLLSFVFCIVSGIVLFLIPRFKSIFEGAGLKLPLLTRIVVKISEVVLSNIWLIVIGVMVFAFLISWALQNFKIRFMVDYHIIRLPVIGRHIHRALIARFCQTLAMLLKGGVGLISAIPLSNGVVVNLYLNQVITEIFHQVTAGATLSDAMRRHKEMPVMMVKMVALGEKSGSLFDMLRRMGEYYDQEVEVFLNNINSVLEPVFIILIGGVVAIVAVSLYLPIFSISTAVR